MYTSHDLFVGVTGVVTASLMTGIKYWYRRRRRNKVVPNSIGVPDPDEAMQFMRSAAQSRSGIIAYMDHLGPNGFKYMWHGSFDDRSLVVLTLRNLLKHFEQHPDEPSEVMLRQREAERRRKLLPRREEPRNV